MDSISIQVESGLFKYFLYPKCTMLSRLSRLYPNAFRIMAPTMSPSPSPPQKEIRLFLDSWQLDLDSHQTNLRSLTMIWRSSWNFNQLFFGFTIIYVFSCFRMSQNFVLAQVKTIQRECKIAHDHISHSSNIIALKHYATQRLLILVNLTLELV